MATKLISFLLLISFHSFGFSVISDLDETIKITGKGPGAIWRALKSTKVYLAMDDFFELLDEEKLIVLTASPKQIRSRIEKLFEVNGMDVNALITRDYFSGESTYEYKYNQIVNILENSSEDFILIGDNTSQDPQVYADIKKNYPQRILDVYIRETNYESDRIPGIKYFFHTIDLALNEYEQRRFKRLDILKLLKPFANLQKNFKLIFPKFAYCPVEESLYTSTNVFGLSQLVERLNKELVIRCRD
jgi:phosphatidate phosphatase APP1